MFHSFIFTIFLLVNTWLLVISHPLATAPSQPNIIWIMSDDLGWGEVGMYPCTSSHGRIKTPHLDTFAKEGLRFTNAYAGYTVCSPSRTTFFTGRHSGQFVKYGLPGTAFNAKKNVTTTAHILQMAGYTTAAFGKIAPLNQPISMGFDDFVGQVSQSVCHNMYPKEIDRDTGTFNVNLTLNYKTKNRDLCMAHPEQYNYTIDMFQENAIRWLEKVTVETKKLDRKPFFLYLSFTIPHAGGWGDAPKNPEQGNPVPNDGQYVNQTDWPNVEKDHAAVITYLDAYVGQLMQKLKEIDADKDTIVFFASDNGAHQEGGHKTNFFNSTGGLRGHKRSYYEGGVRSPTMVRWPGTIKPNTTSDFAWAFWDVMPTFAELAGGEAVPGIDGISIVPTLMGQSQASHDYLYFTWKSKDPGYAVRVDNWKGIVTACNDTKNKKPSKLDDMLLYDLEDDPFEVNDISKEHQDIIKKLKTLVISKNLTCQCYQC